MAKDWARYAYNASRDSLHEDRTLGLMKVPTWYQQGVVAFVGTLLNQRSALVHTEAAKVFSKIAGAHGICLRLYYPVPEFVSLAGSDWVHRPGRPGGWSLCSNQVPQGGPCADALDAGQHGYAAHSLAKAQGHMPPHGAVRESPGTGTTGCAPPSQATMTCGRWRYGGTSNNAPRTPCTTAATKKGTQTTLGGLRR